MILPDADATVPCPGCACVQPHPAHALLAALAGDDLDAALTLGLLNTQECAGCSDACNARVASARDARRFALAARSRHQARADRLARIREERAASRRPAPVIAETRAPTLPKAASDALAKALAKARERHA